MRQHPCSNCRYLGISHFPCTAPCFRLPYQLVRICVQWCSFNFLRCRSRSVHVCSRTLTTSTPLHVIPRGRSFPCIYAQSTVRRLFLWVRFLSFFSKPSACPPLPLFPHVHEVELVPIRAIRFYISPS